MPPTPKLAAELPLLQSAEAAQIHNPPAWISEAVQDLYRYKLGDAITLPLAGRMQPFTVAGIWRDYARAVGFDRHFQAHL